MHVGAVEQRIALAEHGDAAAGIKVRGNRARAAVVEFLDLAAIGGGVLRNLGGHREKQRQLDDVGLEMACDDRARIARITGLGEMRDHVGLLEGAHGFERQQLGIARTDADPNQPGGAAHGPALASALTAAAAMALPPMRPRTIRNGTPRGSAASASFASAAPTKPTGMPRIAAGAGAPPASSSSRWNSAVGAFPIATRAPASFSPHNSTAAADRVVASFSARAGTRASRKVHTTSLRAGSRARVMPCATISLSHRIGAPRA